MNKKEFNALEIRVRSIVNLLKEAIKKEKMKADLFIGGSFAKGTLLEKEKYDVDLYVSWNKPEDLKEFERIESAIKTQQGKNLNEEEKKLLPLWKKYFKK